MKNEIKNKEPRERQGYVPVSVKVIEVTAQSIICQRIHFKTLLNIMAYSDYCAPQIEVLSLRTERVLASSVEGGIGNATEETGAWD